VAALALSAFSAQAATKITAVPYTITAPGTYELTSNLTLFTAGDAITINVPVPGTVVLNLNGFSILWNPNQGAVGADNGIGILNTTSPKTVITIKNGTIGGQDEGFWTGIVVNQNPPNTTNTTYLANVTIDNVTFSAERWSDVELFQVSASTVSNCTFNGLIPGESEVQYGIQDVGSQGGNHYINDKFDGGQTYTLAVEPSVASVITRADFAFPVQ